LTREPVLVILKWSHPAEEFLEAARVKRVAEHGDAAPEVWGEPKEDRRII
jgi:hypothetical protein